MIELYFFTDRATTKDAVLLPALCHDVALFSIALQLLLLVLILCYAFVKALTERLANLSRATNPALEESAQERTRIELQPPGKCLRFGIKWDPDLRLMINTLKKEGEEGLTPFFGNEVFMWKLRSYIRNKVSKAFRAKIKQDMIRLRQLREQKTAVQKMQDWHALRDLNEKVDQASAAAQAMVQGPAEQATAAVQLPVAQEEDGKPDPFLKMLIATSQKKPTDKQLSPEDAAALAAMRAEEPRNSLSKAAHAEQHEAPDAFLKMLIETSKKKPTQMSNEHAAATISMVAEEAASSSPEALLAEQTFYGEAGDEFGQILNQGSQSKPSDSQTSPEDAEGLALLIAEKPASNTEAPTEERWTEEYACDTDGWDYDDFWAYIDVDLPPHLAAAKLFAAMGIFDNSASITGAPAMATNNNMHNEDPFMGFWDKLDANMSPEMVATKLINEVRFINAY